MSEGQGASDCWQWRRRHLRHALTCGEQFGMLPGKVFKFIQRLRTAKAQADLAALVEALMKARKRLLESRIVQGQGVSIASMKSAQWMLG
ncbi:hypothetical protein D3C79_534830 [compost metagenome]